MSAIGPLPAKVGKFEVHGILGRGGMGTVYSAFDPTIQRPVAIKALMKRALDPDQALNVLERFKREAQAAGRLMHPCIVQVYDYGENDELAFIAMELVSGKSLHQRLLERRRYDLKQIGSIVEQLLSALEYAHQNGVIHQDIKPANILVANDGRIKVTDFGIAYVESTRVIVNNEPLGTPHFMAPELLNGDTATPASDVYSAGTVAFELLTGQRAFSGTTAFVMRQVMDPDVAVIAPSQVDPRIVPELDQAVLKGLAKKPAERFQSAHEFQRAFQLGIEATLRAVGETQAPGEVSAETTRNLSAAARLLRESTGNMPPRPLTTGPDAANGANGASPAAPVSSAHKPRLLVVDDEERILNALKALFRDDFHVFATSNCGHALRFVEKFHMHAIISDQRMPEMLGVELLRRAKITSPTSMRLLLTGYSDLNAIVGSINEGEIFRFINKPWSNRDLKQIVHEAVEIGLSVGERRVMRVNPEAHKELTVLVVDPSYELLRSVKELLSGVCEIRHALDADTAMNQLDQYPVAIVLMDVEHAAAEGIALLKTLKQERPAILSIVVTSASDSELMIELINQAQIFRFLNKPVNQQLIKSHLLAALERAQALRDAPELVRMYKPAPSGRPPAATTGTMADAVSLPALPALQVAAVS
ncbi:MAG: protein kinase [Proteobacteria bacterium]|nr:protein kinase [Burkholderiales bacterium]